MRWALALLVLGACSSRYGAYFVIEGDQEFDQLELYFGADSGSDKFATPALGPQSGRVFERQYDASDVVAVPHQKLFTQPAGLPLSSEHHLLISFSSTDIGPPNTVVIRVQPSPAQPPPTTCMTPGYHVMQGGMTFTCR